MVVREFENRAARHEPTTIKNDLPCVQDLVVADIEARKAMGLKRYGHVAPAAQRA